MERHFEKDLNELKERLLWMGSLAERAVHQSVHAVLDSDEQTAKRVLDEEDAINELQLEIDDRVVQLLALHQLMAVDLRFVLAVSRINNDLERIGDQAVNVAQGALRILRHPRVKPYVDLPRMTELVEEQVRNALNAVVRRDVELAQKVMATDDQVDQYRDQIFRELLTYMMGDSSVVFPAFELILVAKNLERIGDLAYSAVMQLQSRHEKLPAADSRQLVEMASLLCTMLEQVHQGFLKRDVAYAQSVLQSDPEVDRLCHSLFHRHLAEPNTASGQKNFDILLAAQALERIGDHAKNLAEELYGLSEGRSLRHNARKLSTA